MDLPSLTIGSTPNAMSAEKARTPQTGLEQPAPGPAARRTVRFSGMTDVGTEREVNEDALRVVPEYRLGVVADGLGGHRSGSIASSLAVDTINDFFIVTVRPDATWPFPYDQTLSEEENYLVTGFRLANRRIFDRSLKTLTDFGMGTTCVALMFSEDLTSAAISNVGDSRGYKLRAGVLSQLTRDHSVVSDAVNAAPWMTAEEIAQLPPNVITRALGIREDVMVDIERLDVQPGDIFLLCSDGLSGQVEDTFITTELARVHSGDELEVICKSLVDAANRAGGVDNVTVVIAHVT